MFNSKVFVAEFIGTFALVFIGAGAGMVGAGLVAVALAHGFTLAVFAYAYGHISGAHVNPPDLCACIESNSEMGQAVFSDRAVCGRLRRQFCYRPLPLCWQYDRARCDNRADIRSQSLRWLLKRC